MNPKSPDAGRDDAFLPQTSIRSQVAMRRRNTMDDWRLPGEEIIFEEQSDVGYLSPVGRKFIGRITITNYRLRFVSTEQDLVNSSRVAKQCRVTVPLCTINRVEKIGHATVTRTEDSYGLEITCKDMRTVKFVSRQAGHSRRDLYEYLTRYAFPHTNKLQFFAYQYTEEFPSWESVGGWEIFDPRREFKRLGVPNDLWTVSYINENYNFADTYPSVFAIPAAAVKQGDDFLNKVANFRSKARIPVLSWLHPETQAALCRCSQPMVGVSVTGSGRRSEYDEKYVKMIIESNVRADRLFIFDARPVVNAQVNKAKGGGFENEEAYPECSLIFLDIQNIHVMRESFRKLRDMCFPRVDEKNFLTLLEESRWLEHVKQIIAGAARIVDKIENHKNSVLVHCSDGWDRTAQLNSLAMLMLDSYYRTIIGFETLVEKEWCAFGHQFATRCGHGEDKHSASERSPVFLQFIDSVWQLTQMFPTAFEFNAQFLICILDELYSCRFGTFLYNTEQMRRRELVRDKTVSLWSFVNSEVCTTGRFVNALYNEATRKDVLVPARSLRRMRLFAEYYLRWNPLVGVHMRMESEERVHQYLLALKRRLCAEAEKTKQQQHGGSPQLEQPARHSPSPNTNLVFKC